MQKGDPKVAFLPAQRPHYGVLSFCNAAMRTSNGGWVENILLITPPE